MTKGHTEFYSPGGELITKEQLYPDDQSHWHGFVSYICGKWEIARRYRPETILEIGIRAGYAAWAFLQAHPKAKYIGLDNYSYGNYPEWAKENLLKGYNVTIEKKDTQEMSELFILADFIHVDGDHTKAGVKHDLDIAYKALNHNGVILIDDYDRIPDVKAGVDEWLEEHPGLDWKYCESFTGDILIGNVCYCLPASKPIEPSEETTKKNGKLLVFHHGMGDLMLFLPLFEHLKKKGKYKLALQEGCGFLAFVDDAVETPGGVFDYDKFCKENNYSGYQIVQFHMSEGTGKTKTGFCAEKEFDLPDFSFSYPEVNGQGLTKMVGINFHGTCLPGQTNPDYETAKKIWNEVKEAGYIPVEIYFQHVFHNPANNRFDFVDTSIRDWPASIGLLLTILSGCRAFIGVASGVWVAAMTKLPKKHVVCLEKAYKAKDYIPAYPSENSIDITNYRPGTAKKWLATHLS